MGDENDEERAMNTHPPSPIPHSPSPDWQALDDELERWTAAGLRARLWLRDDDACAHTEALEVLAALAEPHAIPLLLAAIPARADASLARWLETAPRVSVAVHGWAHLNHAPPSERAQELGLHRGRAAVLDELRRGFERLHALCGARLAPVLVPPWNRIAPALLDTLPGLGFRALSTFGDKPVPDWPAALARIDTHVDLIDWKHGRRCREPAWLVGELAAELARARLAGGRAVGVLTHHLVHDAAATAFLRALFGFTADHAGVHWVDVDELLLGNGGWGMGDGEWG